jgi:rRNA maturation endonuclease Nob1
VILLAGTRHGQQPSQPGPARQAIMRPSYVCDACGAEAQQTAKFCVKCGAQLRRE